MTRVSMEGRYLQWYSSKTGMLPKSGCLKVRFFWDTLNLFVFVSCIIHHTSLKCFFCRSLPKGGAAKNGLFAVKLTSSKCENFDPLKRASTKKTHTHQPPTVTVSLTMKLPFFRVPYKYILYKHKQFEIYCYWDCSVFVSLDIMCPPIFLSTGRMMKTQGHIEISKLIVNDWGQH